MTPGVSKSSLDFSSWICYSRVRTPLLRRQELFLASVHWKTKYSSSQAPKPVFTDAQQSRYLIPFLAPWIRYSCCRGPLWYITVLLTDDAEHVTGLPSLAWGSFLVVLTWWLNLENHVPLSLKSCTTLRFQCPFSPAQASKQRQILRATCPLSGITAEHLPSSGCTVPSFPPSHTEIYSEIAETS